MAEREVVYSLIGLTITKRALEDKRHMSTIGPQFRDCRPPQDFFFPAWVLGSNGTENSLKDLGRLRATLVIAKIDRLARNVAFVANLIARRARCGAGRRSSRPATAPDRAAHVNPPGWPAPRFGAGRARARSSAAAPPPVAGGGRARPPAPPRGRSAAGGPSTEGRP